MAGMVDERDRAGRTALHYAATDGKIEDVRRLLTEGADVNAREVKGWTPLHGAANQGNLEIVDILIAAGADVNALDDRGEGPLFIAAAVGGRGNGPGVVRALLDAGADRNRKSFDRPGLPGISPVEWVQMFDDNHPVKRLLNDQ